jgi:hypothetical protein
VSWLALRPTARGERVLTKTKEKNSLRKSDRDSAVVQRRLKLARHFDRLHPDSDPGLLSGGRFRKGRPFACPRARCGMCQWAKLHGVLSHRDRTADLDAREQLAHYASDRVLR